ncbi:MAG TPA: acyltransferase family protein [Methanothrix sp.]|nr:acyltransferase family protein [Methanothrix sp.]
MAEKTGRGRLLFIDNIRWTVIVLVVMVHAAVTYSGLGRWYYYEPQETGALSGLFFGFFLSSAQAFSMGLLFLLAGYFVPASFDRKGPGGFLRGRAVRLGIPTLIFMLFLEPLLSVLPAAVRGDPVLSSAGRRYLEYILTLEFLGGTGPMWFTAALLIFSAAYAAFRCLSLRKPGRKEKEYNGHDSPSPPLPGWKGGPKALPMDRDGWLPGHRHLAALALLVAATAFAIRIFQPIGTDVLNMQLCFFAQYIILFIVGIAAYRMDLLLRIPSALGMDWLKAALLAGPAIWLAMMLAGGAASGNLAPFWGRLHWQSAAYALWESFFSVGMCLGIIVLFRDRWNRQGSLERFLSDNYFSVYVFHPPILVLVSLALRPFGWHPIAKFIAACAIALPLCFLASHFILRKIPLLGAVLLK